MIQTINLYDLSLAELTELVKELGEPTYRAEQVWRWLYTKYAADIGQMTDLPKEMRQRLALRAYLGRRQPLARQLSIDGQTEKVLFELEDKNYVETVLMQYTKRRTLCISTQAGCAMGCVFCATGQMGFSRNLRVGEIISQVMYFADELAANGEKVTNVVMMGMGEPFHNYDNVMAAIDTLTDESGFNLGARRITISTVGLVPAIRRFARERRQSRLAVSLHAATDEERNRLIPIGRRWPIAELMDACRFYVDTTGRRLSVEWALISGRNDTAHQARLLGKLLEGLLCHVNLIPLNPTDGYAGLPSSRKRVNIFQEILAGFGIRSSVRVRRGLDIDAGCGQLRERMVRDTNLSGPPSGLAEPGPGRNSD